MTMSLKSFLWAWGDHFCLQKPMVRITDLPELISITLFFLISFLINNNYNIKLLKV